ncbi:MAG: LPS assembly protein LptD, partial [Sedimentisphaerales bacterium]
VSDSSFDAEMHDVELKVEDRTIFYWPYMRSNMQRPDVPLKSIHAGHDSTWGTSVQTQWHLSRMLGLREPEGTESTLALDYYSKRGVGGGAEIKYAREDHFGRIGGYIIRDRGEDRLGRHSSRRNLKPPRELRGQFFWRHRHFLPYNWQATMGVGYSSDEHFLEEYYRSEFNAGAERETYIHMKRLEDNWALSLMGKGRLNDFADEKEELPGVEFHLTGQSLFDDRFTFYSDTEVSRLRQRIGNEHSIAINEDHFTFASQRAELDMPVRMDSFKVVPFVAGTFGYDDRSGFRRSLVDGSYTGRFGDDKVWLGEAGVRIGTQYWKVYPDIKSRLWDLNGLRHIIKPQLTAVYYEESDLVVNQRDTLNVAVSQRLQTKRGPADNQRMVDWLRLDMDVTLVEDSSHDAGTSGPDRFMWNKPFVPLRVLSSPEIFSGDLSGLQRFEVFGPRRNYFGADAVFRLSDTAAVLGDMNFDMQSGVVQQLNVGFSRMRWPNLSYYIGSRYLRRVEVLDEKGSNAFTFAATYMLDPRYTVVFSQQYDFDYGKNLRNDITLIRRYHRVYCALTFSADESLDRQSVVFSIWPQGVPEIAIGPRRYMGLGGSAGY